MYTHSLVHKLTQEIMHTYVALEPQDLENENDRVQWMIAVVLPFFVYLFVRWITLIRNGDHYPMYDQKHLVKILFGSLIAMYLFENQNPRAMALPCFYIASYLFTQMLLQRSRYIQRE